MSLETKINPELEPTNSVDSPEIDKLKKRVLLKSYRLKFDSEQYQKALEILSNKYIYRELGNNELKVGKIGHIILKEKNVRFNYY